MTQIKAEQKYNGSSPRKISLVAKAIKRLPVKEAQNRLQLMRVRAAGEVLAVLKQAVANGVNNLKLSEANLSIKAIEVEEGPVYKRWQPVSRGRAHAIHKPTSHIRIILETKEERGTKS